MKVTVFGATGGVGGQVVRQALDAGHAVTAVVRDPARLEVRGHPALEVVTVPGLTDPALLRPALEGRDAAISAVGPGSRKQIGIASRTAPGILRALELAGVRRFVAVSAMPLGPIPDGERWLTRRILVPLFRVVLRDLITDLTAMEEAIRRSATDWTVVRPPRFVNTPVTGRYRMAIGGTVPRGLAISRADVAHAMLAVLDNPATINQPVGIAR